MNPSVLTAVLWCFPPPVPPEQTDVPPPPADAAAEGEEASPEDAPAEEAPADGDAPMEDAPVEQAAEPTLEYGEPSDAGDLQYADEAAPGPQLDYAEPAPDESVRYAEVDGRRSDVPSKDAIAGANSGITRRAPRQKPEGSPQRFAMELKFGPYLPRVDAAAGGDGFGPYATIFGQTDDSGVVNAQPDPGLFSVLGFEWQFYNLGGPFSIGTTVGFFRDTADALLANPEDGENVRSEADTTSFLVVPITVLLGYRFELLADRYKVPIVPYARGGLGYGLWWSFDGTGNASENEAGVPGRGGSFGWQVNLGGMLRLDFLSPGTARQLDRTTGINHVYLFGEYQFSRLNGFTDGARLAVGDDTWLVGLAVEF